MTAADDTRRRGKAVDPHGFPKTWWTELDEARHSTSVRNRVLARYYRPARAYVQYLCKNPAEADDVVNEFFAHELNRLVNQSEGGVVRSADPERGRFRDLLRRSLYNYWLSTKRRLQHEALQASTVTLDMAVGGEHNTPERAFDRAWIEGILAEALHRTEARCSAVDKHLHYRLMVAFYLPGGEATSWEALAHQHNLRSGKDARNKADTALRHYRAAITEVVGEDVPAEAVSQEIRDLINRLGGDHE